jgi:hypothetical protein
MRRASLFLLLLALLAQPASANNCVEVRFSPAVKDLQIVIWIEDLAGKVLETPYITRLTGQFGLANRPGAPLLKTDFKWPYGRREMVMPIWAHRRDKHYPKVMMGGVCGHSPSTRCPDSSLCAGDCEDSTIAYHSRVSSYEPFYCSPSGPSGIDVMSCASKGTFAKGAYAPPPAFSLYPPRADITAFNSAVDHADLKDFAAQNDLVAVSAATPPAGAPVDPPVSWIPAALPEGDYVAYIELSQESDFNASHDHPNQADTVSAWDFEGHKFLGQPSIIYTVPFHYGATASSAIATQYAGYSTWDGSDGVIHPPDGTITTNKVGSGAGRLMDVNDGVDVYRVKVVVGTCSVRPGPTGGAITNLVLTPSANAIKVSFQGPPGEVSPERYQVRYREGSTPITGEMFDMQIAGPNVAAGAPGATLTTDLVGLQNTTSYAVGVRAVSASGEHSAVVSQVASTVAPKYAVLHGCFVATAAFGSPMARSVDALRAFRDRRLLSNPAGQLATAVYYAFSPPLANAIATDDALRALARAALRPIVALLTR